MFISHLGVFTNYNRFMQKQKINQTWDLTFFFLFIFMLTFSVFSATFHLVTLLRLKKFLSIQRQLKRIKFSVLRSPFIYKSSWEQFFFAYYILKVKKNFILHSAYGVSPFLLHFKSLLQLPLLQQSTSFSCKFFVTKQD